MKGEYSITTIASNLEDLNSLASILNKMNLRRYTDVDENEVPHIVEDVKEVLNYNKDNEAPFLGLDQWERKVFIVVSNS